MYKKIIILISIPLFFSSNLNAQLTLDWVGTMGSNLSSTIAPRYEQINDITTDAQGNSYILGIFKGEADLDPTPGIDIFYGPPNAIGKEGDLFFSKYSPDNNYLWTKHLKGISDNSANFGVSIKTDSDTNIIISGILNSSFDVDPSGDSLILVENSGTSISFIAKYNADGELLWAHDIKGGTIAIKSITLDSENNIYATGEFRFNIFFDEAMDTILYSNTKRTFVVKYNPQGVVVWAKQLESNDNNGSFSICTDFDNNFYLAGHFNDVTDFDLDTSTVNNIASYPNYGSAYLAKYDSNGTFLWVNTTNTTNENFSVLNKLVLHSSNINNDVCLIGNFNNTLDLNFGSNLTANGTSLFFAKYDENGNNIHKFNIGRVTEFDLDLDEFDNYYITGQFNGDKDFDPSLQDFSLNTGVGSVFVAKYDVTGNFILAEKLGGIGQSCGNTIHVNNQKIQVGGYFNYTVDFDPTANQYNVTASGDFDIFYLKLNQKGVYGFFYNDLNLDCIKDFDNNNFAGIKAVINPGNIMVESDSSGRWYLDSLSSGNYTITLDTNRWETFCPITQNFTVIDSNKVTYAPNFGVRAKFGFIKANIFNDVSEDCIKQVGESGLASRVGEINPGGIIIFSDSTGLCISDTLELGNYTLSIDTSNAWKVSCPTLLNISVQPYGVIDTTYAFGLITSKYCNSPQISVNMPSRRRCFSDQKIYIEACNTGFATGILNNAYVDLELDSLIIPNSSSISYTSLGNNSYRFNIGSLNPGQCVDFWLSTTISCNAILGQSLCVQANLYPADSCTFDTIPTSPSTCLLPWDKSSLMVDGWCQNDSIYFTITNTGDFGNGDMQCYAPVRIYIDGVYTLLDSVLLVGGQTYVYGFPGDGRTWHLEADQHPLHPGNSHPNATVELCGNSNNWTPNLVNILPMDDADPVVDIYCGVVTGSYDPNDKTGYPLGVGTDHIVTPNGKLDYVIRFQNTGTDTAFTVVVRDTLDVDLDIFSVRSGVSSHNYTFKMFGPRVMEWTFNNIMLPDSSTDQEGSNGFVTFNVLQNPNLPDGTEINNRVGIYFDFNDPIITNTTSHIIGRELYSQAWTEETTIALAVCDEATINNFTYNQTGNYFQVVDDTLYTIELTINRNEITINEQGCIDFSLNGQTYTESGVYIQTLTNSFNCDSVITINLTINIVDTTIVLNGNNLSANLNNAIYQWIDCDNNFSPILGEINQSYSPTTNGNYAVAITENNCTDTSSCVNMILTNIEPINSGNIIQFYPNPTGEKLSIMLNTPQELYIEIYSIDGKLMGSKIISRNTVLDVSNYSIGMYFITAKSKTGKIYQSKFVKE